LGIRVSRKVSGRGKSDLNNHEEKGDTVCSVNPQGGGGRWGVPPRKEGKGAGGENSIPAEQGGKNVLKEDQGVPNSGGRAKMFVWGGGFGGEKKEFFALERRGKFLLKRGDV